MGQPIAMETSKSYKILPELKIVLDVFSGVTRLREMIEKFTAITSDPSYDPTFHYIGDLRETYVDISPAELKSYVEFLSNTVIAFGEQRAAILVSNPRDTALSYLLMNHTERLPFNISVYSGIKDAMFFVQIDSVHQELIEATLQELKAL